MVSTVVTDSTAIPELGVVALVRSHALARPEHPAVRYRETTLSYADLESRSDRLAQALRARGVSVGDRVGVCLEPELDVPAALLAILKIGAAYVPLDPQYPSARVADILGDVRPRAIITRTTLRDRLGLPAPLLLLDVDSEWIAAQDPAFTLAEPDENRVATIFFTSGTTGRPKGARATHRQLAFYARAARQRLEHTPDDVIPTIARFSFSISIFELLVPLTAGATVLVLDRDDIMDPSRMAAALERVTFFHMGPSLLRGVLAEIAGRGDAATRYARVRHASSGGDMVPPQILAALRDAFPNAGIYVLYGCSEISCMGTCYELHRSGPVARTYVGQPFPEMSLLVLGDDGQPAPAGEVGEVYFAGPGVIPGYLDRPELDQERFVSVDGRRYYRTGDLGRWHDGPGLELVGRADFQIKVRGMRVESAEVEYHLRQVPGVRDAAVALRARRGEDVLAAFVVRDPSVADDASLTLATRIRRALAERVPDFMVPSAIVELEALPLNHNLKLDRRALPALDDVRAAETPTHPPRTATERWLADVWSELLGRADIGRRDNFFELGGDSLLGLQLILRVERERGVRLEGIDVLRESLGTLASLCSNAGTDEQGEAGGDDEAAPDEIRRESFYFGPDDSLYGVLERPSGPSELAVLICGPIGAEDVRPSWVFSLLMRKLASRGLPVMRFDWFGTRDSAGDGAEGHPERWREDILAARAELMRRSGSTRVLAIGVRAAALLLCTTIDGDRWERVLLWDPIEDGAAFVRDMRRTEQTRRAQSFPRLRHWLRRERTGVEEILGFSWSSSALDALGRLRCDTQDNPSMRRVVLQDGALWSKTSKLLEQMPDTFVVQSLLRAMEDAR